jgi:uncharacterized protein
MKSKLSLVTLLLLVSSSFSFAEITPEKKEEIDHMMKLTGMEKLTQQMMDQMFTVMTSKVPSSKASVIERIKQKLKSSDLLEKFIPIYDKYYSLEDLRAVNAFYKTPAGQKVLSTMPQVMQESMAMGQEWGAAIAKEVKDELKAEKEAEKLGEDEKKTVN